MAKTLTEIQAALVKLNALTPDADVSSETVYFKYSVGDKVYFLNAQNAYQDGEVIASRQYQNINFYQIDVGVVVVELAESFVLTPAQVKGNIL